MTEMGIIIILFCKKYYEVMLSNNAPKYTQIFSYFTHFGTFIFAQFRQCGHVITFHFHQNTDIIYSIALTWECGVGCLS